MLKNSFKLLANSFSSAVVYHLGTVVKLMRKSIYILFGVGYCASIVSVSDNEREPPPHKKLFVIIKFLLFGKLLFLCAHLMQQWFQEIAHKTTLKCHSSISAYSGNFTQCKIMAAIVFIYCNANFPILYMKIGWIYLNKYELYFGLVSARMILSKQQLNE